MAEQWSPIWLSLKCALLSALINLPWGIFWGWILARKEFKGKILLQTLLYIPLVLPPVLTGYFLLLLFSKNSFLGQFFEQTLGMDFVLDWKGCVLAASIVSGPFMILLVKESISKVDQRLEFVARNLGVSPIRAFWTVTFPLSWQGIVAGFFLVFARSIGEFGATIIVAGNIPGKTQTIPMAIYGHVYLGQDSAILNLVIAAILLSYGGLWLSNKLVKQNAV